MAVNKSLASWYRPTPAYTPLSQVAFGPLEQWVQPMPVPQMPAPTGIRGGNQPTMNKNVNMPNVVQVLNTSRQMGTF